MLSLMSTIPSNRVESDRVARSVTNSLVTGAMFQPCYAQNFKNDWSKSYNSGARFTKYLTTHTHPFNGPFSGTTQVSRYQKGKTNLDFTGARDSEWQWHQLDHMQVCSSVQTDNHTSTPPLSFYRPDALPATQPTVSKH